MGNAVNAEPEEQPVVGNMRRFGTFYFQSLDNVTGFPILLTKKRPSSTITPSSGGLGRESADRRSGDPSGGERVSPDLS
jgi:hypothetical protein